ncbi:MAG: DUF4271 domain-containing protein [Flavobacteriales bacterium]|nr:DUF4271 domain-containing protein [Flavobacteriales bacterium]
MKKTYSYQQEDSITQQNGDSIVKSNKLKLLTVEDESALIIPEIKKVKKSLLEVVEKVPIDSNSAPSDTILYEQRFDNIPTRKIVPLVAHKQGKEIENLPYTPEINNAINTTWQTMLLLIAFGLLGFIKAFSSTRFNQIIKSIFSMHAAEEVVREEKVFFHRVNLSLFLLYVIGVLLLIISILIFYSSDVILSGIYIKIALFIIAAYVVKFTSTLVISAIFSRKDLSETYAYNTLIYNYLFGVILLPCLAFIYFSNIPFEIIINYVIIPSFAFTFLFRIFRLFMVGIQNNFFVLYIILYICTLEILPLVVLSKFFIFK